MARATRARRAPGVLASFVHVDAAVDAIRALRARGHRNLVVYSAAPNHEIEEALDQSVSPVRLFTLIGGLTGCAAGFGMTIWMSLDWPLLVGGKTIASTAASTWTKEARIPGAGRARFSSDISGALPRASAASGSSP